MSAGKVGEYPGEAPITVISDPAELAPQFRATVLAVVRELRAQGYDAIIHETYRTHETALVYYARGRTQIPPAETCTNAPDETWSWHGYKLACDIISEAKGWDAPETFCRALRDTAVRHGLASGYDWKRQDKPHVQPGNVRVTPSEHARELLASGGIAAVWAAVGDGEPSNGS